MGHEILLILFNFFQDHNFPLFVASSQESQMSSMEWQELQNVYFCFCSLQWRHKFVQYLKMDDWLFTKVKLQH